MLHPQHHALTRRWVLGHGATSGFEQPRSAPCWHQLVCAWSEERVSHLGHGFEDGADVRNQFVVSWEQAAQVRCSLHDLSLKNEANNPYTHQGNKKPKDHPRSPVIAFHSWSLDFFGDLFTLNRFVTDFKKKNKKEEVYYVKWMIRTVRPHSLDVKMWTAHNNNNNKIFCLIIITIARTTRWCSL